MRKALRSIGSLVASTCLALFLASAALGAGLALDASFNGVGSLRINTLGYTPHWHVTRAAPGNKLVLVGSVCAPHGCEYLRHLVVARLDANGSLDATFAPASTTPGANEYDLGATVFDVGDAAVDSLGRILITGRTAADETAVVRLLADGALDPSFSASSPSPGVFRKSYGALEAAQAIAIDAQGRIVLSGFVRVANATTPFVARVTASGGTDFSFNGGGSTPGMLALPQVGYGAATALKLDSQGRIVIAGIHGATELGCPARRINFNECSGPPFVARVTDAGALDASHNPAGSNPGIATLAGFNDAGRYSFGRIVMQLDGNDSAVIGGFFQFLQFGVSFFRVRADGTEDPAAWSYTPSWPKFVDPYDVGPVSAMLAVGAPAELGDMALDTTGRAFLSGLYLTDGSDIRLFVYRAAADLSPDSGFGPDIPAPPPNASYPPTRGFRTYDLTAGNSSAQDRRPEGASLALVPGGLVVTSRAVLLQGDGPVLMISPEDGSLIASFGNAGMAFTGQIGNLPSIEANNRYGLNVLPDNRLIVVDSALIAQNYLYASYVLQLARFTAAGQADNTLNPGALQPFLRRYLSDLDADVFSPGRPPFSASLLDSTGKIVVLAFGQIVPDLGHQIMLFRFNANGTIDPTFNAGGHYPGLNRRLIADRDSSGAQLAQDTLGRYYVVGTGGGGGGSFAFVARFNANGTNDLTFNDGINDHVRVTFGTGATAACSSGETLRVDPNGKVLVGGLTQECQTLQNRIFWRYGALARLNSDGSLDTSFNPGGARPGTLVLPSAADRGVHRIASLIDDAAGNLLVPHGTTPREFAPGPLQPLWSVRVLRLTPNGTVDASYGGGQGYIECDACDGGLNVAAATVAAVRSPDGRIYITSEGVVPAIFPTFTLPLVPPVIMRLDASGNRDTAFGVNGELQLASSLSNGYVVPRDLKFDNAGRLVVQGVMQIGDQPNATQDLLLQRYLVTTGQSQTITFGPLPGRTFGGAAFAVSATATSGLLVTFTSQTGSVCTAVGNIVTLIAAGNCTIAADQPGNAAFDPAPQVSRTFAVARAASSTSIATSSASVASGADIVFTASVSPGLAGTVAFNNGGIPIAGCSAVPLAAGQAQCATSTLPVGVHSIVASFGGNANYLPSLAGLTQVVVASCVGFVDVADNDPLCGAVEWMRNRSITLGCLGNAFCPLGPVNRVQMAAFLNRLGSALTHQVAMQVAAAGPVDLDAGTRVCATTDIVSGTFPRRVWLDAIFGATAAANVDFEVQLVRSVDAGASWQPVTSAGRKAFARAGHWSNTHSLGHYDMAAGAPARFALAIGRGGQPGTQDLSDSACRLRLRAGSRTSSASPFDAIE